MSLALPLLDLRLSRVHTTAFDVFLIKHMCFLYVSEREEF